MQSCCSHLFFLFMKLEWTNSSLGLLGVQLVALGMIRAFFSYGICRLIIYIQMTLSYILLAFSQEYSFLQEFYKSWVEMDHLWTSFVSSVKYTWILHFASGISLFENSLQVCSLYPTRVGSLVGMANSVITLNTLFPQLFLKSIQANFVRLGCFLILRSLTSKKSTLYSFKTIMFVLAALSTLSMILGLLAYPWHNLPQASEEAVEIRNVNYEMRPLLIT